MLNYDGSSLFISQKDIEVIHEYTLKTLSEVGMIFDHPEVLEVLKSMAPGWTATRFLWTRR